MQKVQQMGKYTPETLLPALELFIEARNKAIEMGFTDNGGAIHSVERILDILAQRLRYPALRHINGYKTASYAEISMAAYEARERGESIFIEHVMPQRAFARKVIELYDAGTRGDDLLDYIATHYRLVLLSADETREINRINRSVMTEDRIDDAGIELRK